MVGCYELTGSPPLLHALCGKHFLMSDFLPFSLQLRKMSVSSVFNFPAHVQRSNTERRPLKRHNDTKEVSTTMPPKKAKSSPSKDQLNVKVNEQNKKIKVLQQKVKK